MAEDPSAATAEFSLIERPTGKWAWGVTLLAFGALAAAASSILYLVIVSDESSLKSDEEITRYIVIAGWVFFLVGATVWFFTRHAARRTVRALSLMKDGSCRLGVARVALGQRGTHHGKYSRWAVGSFELMDGKTVVKPGSEPKVAVVIRPWEQMPQPNYELAGVGFADDAGDVGFYKSDETALCLLHDGQADGCPPGQGIFVSLAMLEPMLARFKDVSVLIVPGHHLETFGKALGRELSYSLVLGVVGTMLAQGGDEPGTEGDRTAAAAAKRMVDEASGQSLVEFCDQRGWRLEVSRPA